MVASLVDDKKLGKLKLEFAVKKAVFLAPKCYYLELLDNSKYIKIKGIKKTYLNKAIENDLINFNTFKDLLNKDNNIIINQDK